MSSIATEFLNNSPDELTIFQGPMNVGKTDSTIKKIFNILNTHKTLTNINIIVPKIEKLTAYENAVNNFFVSRNPSTPKIDKNTFPNINLRFYKIINTKNPKIHYKVGGFMEKFSIVLKRILPDRMYEKILMNHYKL